jgi:hypothetical protein
MHKNNYGPKTLNGNWLENRYTENYDALNDATSNTYLPNPCKLKISNFLIAYNKYVPTARDLGN